MSTCPNCSGFDHCSCIMLCFAKLFILQRIFSKMSVDYSGNLASFSYYLFFSREVLRFRQCPLLYPFLEKKAVRYMVIFYTAAVLFKKSKCLHNTFSSDVQVTGCNSLIKKNKLLCFMPADMSY